VNTFQGGPMLGIRSFGELSKCDDRVQDVGSGCVHCVEEFSDACSIVVFGVFLIVVTI
jgi:hypothetical protein